MQITERPYNINFSLNDIRYVFLLDQLQRPGLRLQVKLLAKPLGGTFSEVYTFLLQPAPDGTIYLYLQEYINSLLTYVRPPFSTANMFTNADKQACIFTVHYREVSDGVETPDYTTTEETDYVLYAIKGGIEKQLFSRNNFFKLFEANKPFLTWQPAGRFIDKNEVTYLTFLNPNYNSEDLTQSFFFCYKVTDVNNAIEEHQVAFTTTGLLVHLCIDFALLGFALQVSQLYKIECGVVAAGAAVAYNYTYYFEHRPRYTYYDLLLHNSISGLDFIRVKGDVTESFDRTVAEGSGGKDVLSLFADYREQEAMYAGISLQRKYKGDVGYLYEKKWQYALMELLASSNIYMRNSFRWVPVVALQKSQELGIRTNSIPSFPIEWALSESNEVYTPDLELNIGDTTMLAQPVPPFCANVTGLTYGYTTNEDGTYSVSPVFVIVPGVFSYTAKLTNITLANTISQDFTVPSNQTHSEGDTTFSPVAPGEYSIAIITHCSDSSHSIGTSIDFALDAFLCPAPGEVEIENTTPSANYAGNTRTFTYAYNSPGGTMTETLYNQDGASWNVISTNTLARAAGSITVPISSNAGDGTYRIGVKTICSEGSVSTEIFASVAVAKPTVVIAGFELDTYTYPTDNPAQRPLLTISFSTSPWPNPPLEDVVSPWLQYWPDTGEIDGPVSYTPGIWHLTAQYASNMDNNFYLRVGDQKYTPSTKNDTYLIWNNIPLWEDFFITNIP